MNRKIVFIIFSCAILLVACNPTRRLQDNEYLLTKNEIKFTDGTYNKEPLLTIMKQKPNRKIFGLFRFHLWLYNTVNEEKMKEKKEKKVKKAEAWNLAHPDKKPKDLSEVSTWRETVQKIGEEPVIVDTALTNRSATQLNIYLKKKGYFNSTVHDSIEQVGKKKAKVVYSISLRQPYKFRSITDSSLDRHVMQYVDSVKAKTELHPGDNYDEDVMDKERIRITTTLRDSGYYYFNKNYITYTVDSNLNSHQVDVGLYINSINENASERTDINDSIRNHQQYYLNNIYIQTDYNPQSLDESITSDTVYYNDYIFISTTHYERYRKDVILGTIFFKKGDRFDLSQIDFSYSRINDLNIFKYTNIRFEEVGIDSLTGRHLLNVFVQLSPTALQDVSFEPEATRNGGYAGIAGNIAYHHKNLFKGAELLEIKFKAAIESQQNITGTIAPSEVLFNTIEFGPELNLTFKRFLFPFSLRGNGRTLDPKTTFTTSYNFQDHPDYHRSVLSASYWSTWKETPTERLTVYFAEISHVNVTYVSPAFQQNLDSLHNPVLTNSFKTHNILSIPKASLELSDQEKKHGINFSYLRINFDDGIKINDESFSFIRVDFDARHYFRLNANNKFVVRALAGYGWPLGGANSLPFERAFYAGGPNDIRAWQYSLLGPGAYPNPLRVEQSGDMKLEANAEVRSELFRFIEGAAFIDAGNIWATKDTSTGPESIFHGSDFLKQVAVGAGVGIRLNFNFFVFRIDGAVRVYDPAQEEPFRWVYAHHEFVVRDINFNFGIGYPF